MKTKSVSQRAENGWACVGMFGVFECEVRNALRGVGVKIGTYVET